MQRRYDSDALKRDSMMSDLRYLLGLALFAAAVAVAISFASPARAACVIVGSGTQTSLQTGDTATCTGAANTEVVTNNGESDVAINVGDGAPTSFTGGLNTAVGLDTASNSTVTVFDQATISANAGGIGLSGGGNNTITVNAGASISTALIGSAAINLTGGSSNNIITIGGTLGDLSAGADGVSISGGGTGNQITVLSSGILQNGDGNAFDFNTAAGGNTINNAGTLSVTVNGHGIYGSTGDDTVFNSGTISTAGTTAINLRDGADTLTLLAGSSITGIVEAGAGVDTLGFGGGVDSSFNIATFGAGLKYRDFRA
jgi:hypothetical protein